ncbi:probable glutamate--tRNA ligase, mitochondrial, partial [Chrysoperla carnea]|uniref:probable glutamate--tRNA ligase, mitochondrial n=1 Tax=Chrysoperla carnea TaxID=189513 RepID=UPI001D05D6E3
MLFLNYVKNHAIIFTKHVRYFSNSKSFHSKIVRVRFAPSPTGFLHLGGLRTALFNYLFARANKGKFILRIEDTDQTRIVPESVQQLINDLKWAGLEIDEGPNVPGAYGPYTQSQRTDIYQKYIKILLENKSAYHCFCTDRRLNLIRREALKAREIPKYDNRCRYLTDAQVTDKLNKGEKSCIRFKLRSDCETFEDLVYGNIAYDVALNEGDPVIMKGDGYPTYHFANVVDDHLMDITHVLRGVEWQISTTKHILMYRAFNWEPPKFGHLPLLLNSDGTKLSKRQGDIHISSFREAGIFPQALINFVTHSGGGFDRDSELRHYSMAELIELFNIKRVNSHSTRLMPEKLLEYNRLALMNEIKNENSLNNLITEVKNMAIKLYPKENEKGLLQLNENHIRTILVWAQNRIHKLSDLFAPNFSFLWILPTISNLTYDEKLYDIALSLQIMLKNEKENLKKDHLNIILRDFSVEKQIRFIDLMKFLRLVFSGLEKGPGVAEMMEILGKNELLLR